MAYVDPSLLRGRMMQVLENLYEYGPASAHELASSLHHNLNTTRTVIGLLADRRYVEIEECMAGCREHFLHLTESGASVLNKPYDRRSIWAIRHPKTKQAFEHLRAMQDAQRERLLGGLPPDWHIPS